MNALERLSNVSFGLRLVLVVIFVWAFVVLAVGLGVVLGDLSFFQRAGSVIAGALIWYVPSALLWFLAGGYKPSE